MDPAGGVGERDQRLTMVEIEVSARHREFAFVQHTMPTTTPSPNTGLAWPFDNKHFQKKIDETEAKRQQYEQQRDTLKTKIHGLNSIDMKVCRLGGGKARQ